MLRPFGAEHGPDTRSGKENWDPGVIYHPSPGGEFSLGPTSGAEARAHRGEGPRDGPIPRACTLADMPRETKAPVRSGGNGNREPLGADGMRPQASGEGGGKQNGELRGLSPPGLSGLFLLSLLGKEQNAPILGQDGTGHLLVQGLENWKADCHVFA